ncbi:MAG: EAL domain-containing protein [Sulfuriflexus sp.]|nr:EAL domain-containing protein [Sulfuriflexus sp.]
MNKNAPPESYRHGLRRSYLLISAFFSLVIITVTIFSSLHVLDVTAQNTKALQLQETVSNLVFSIRRDVATANTLLDELLLSPTDERNADIKEYLADALRKLKKLSSIPNLEETGLSPLINELSSHTELMNQNILELLVLRQDPQWIYPVLTIMNRDMLNSNVLFTSSVELILHDMGNLEELDNKKFAFLNDLTSIRDAWRIMILNFRAVLLRFAGLNKIDQIEQEQDVTLIHKQISKKITTLINASNNDDYDLDVEQALEVMAENLDDWITHFKRFQTLRAATIWRADIHFTSTNIRPIYNQAINVLEKLDTGISDWSTRNSAAVKDAAYKVNIELFVLSALALAFVITIYIILNRLVLRPIARISDSFSKESHGEEFILPRRGSREIYNLVSAYNRMREIIEQRQHALEHQALHDNLTGLPNRALLQDRLEHAIQYSDRNDSSLAFMLIDLDRFKEINDTLGHQVGDRVLNEISTRLRRCLRKSDTVARLGGDEFALIISDTEAAQATQFSKKISAAINEVLVIDNQNLYIGASIGISMYPEDGLDSDTLVRYADIAMYSAKQNNLDNALFNSKMDKMSVDNLSLLGDFREELNNQTGQLKLYYQPKIDLFNKKIVSVEALLRWHHPQQGFISPEFIIRMAEQSGLIGNLTTWVIEQAICDCAQWQKNKIDLGVSINLSAWNLQDPKLPHLIESVIEKNKLLPEALSFEITESAVMKDPTRAREVLEQLDERGISLEIDDYGTGFSSLAYLKLLPVNTLKIDKSFVIDMLKDPNDLIIVRSTIELAHNLGMLVIAEGVEDSETLLRLQQLKCDSAQGFYIARPLPKDELYKWVDSYDLNALL